MIRVQDHPRDTLFGLPVADCKMLEFELAPELEAAEPPETRGLGRDEVRLMISRYADRRDGKRHDDRIAHTRSASGRSMDRRASAAR